LIDGDLKVREFIYDKAQIIKGSNGLWDKSRAPFNAWTEEITFVAAYGASATPTWKLARLSANTSANLFVTERTNTNDVVITLGPLKDDPNPVVSKTPLTLVPEAMSQHNSRVAANAIAVSVSGQSH
jgi:hypothetical protein